MQACPIGSTVSAWFAPSPAELLLAAVWVVEGILLLGHWAELLVGSNQSVVPERLRTTDLL